ncbi:GNAT family N-acetyltransferase [Streptomyces sp. BSP1]|uniref:GNAT family N-acetyltransferase n=1 Tax=Streptomyces sp. BSP1 TaxID=2944804 RepID=UPI00211E9F44|nr:GNAT family N-acetyltransferase [Streptomyces sp. BSP1]MCQ9709933.1 GNAT family N-acetyltransferase [Streptomyces sp. BSP1]
MGSDGGPERRAVDDGPNGRQEEGGWRLTGSLEEFLTAGGAYLRSRPALHTVALTVSDALGRRGLDLYGDEPPRFGWRAVSGEVSAVLLWTPPHVPMVVGGDEAAARGLARVLAEGEGPAPGGVGAPVEQARAFAGEWARTTGQATWRTFRKRLYRLGGLHRPALPPGRARSAGEADRATLERWHDGFAADVGATVGLGAAAWVDAGLARGGIRLWEDGGRPVAMAVATLPVAGSVRVTTVYTPPALRGRGYAGAVTADLSARVTAGGAEAVLFTDVANPTSNGLYRRLGYEPLAEFEEYAFGAGRGEGSL